MEDVVDKSIELWLNEQINKIDELLYSKKKCIELTSQQKRDLIIRRGTLIECKDKLLK